MSRRHLNYSAISKAIVFEIKGQSNAVGIEVQGNISSDLAVAPRRTFVYRMDGDAWEQTIAGVNINGVLTYPDHFGIQPRLYKLLKDYYKINIYGTTYGYGGVQLAAGGMGSSGLGNWSQTGTIYPASIIKTNDALRAMPEAYRLPTVIWIQGEDDCANSGYSNNYRVNLTELITAYRNDTGRDARWINVSLSSNQTNLNAYSSNRTIINSAMENTAQWKYSGGVFTENTGQYALPGVYYIVQNNSTFDGIHYNNAGLGNIATDVFNCMKHDKLE